MYIINNTHIQIYCNAYNSGIYREIISFAGLDYCIFDRFLIYRSHEQ